MRYDLVDLRLFLHIAETGSITSAAALSGLALASASARIKGMEETLGTRLLERQRRGVKLTAAGDTLVHHARTIQNQIAIMAGDLGAHAAGLRARVKLVANTGAATGPLQELLSSFLAHHHVIDVELEERASHTVVEMVASGAADLGIAASWAGFSNLNQRAFCTDQLTVITARNAERFAGLRSLRLDKVIDEPFVGLSVGNALQEHLIRQAARLGRHLKFRIRVATPEVVCRFVADGIGVAIIPEAVVRTVSFRNRLRSIPLADDWALRNLHLCARDFANLSPQASLLSKWLSSNDEHSSGDSQRRSGMYTD